jgi:hypothetical protein
MAMRQSSAAWRAVAKISWAFLRKGLTKCISAAIPGFAGGFVGFKSPGWWPKRE